MNKIWLRSYLSEFNKVLSLNEHRGLVILTGKFAHSQKIFADYIDQQNCSNLIKINYFTKQPWLSCPRSWQFIDEKHYRHQLGLECDFLYFEDEHFNVDAFAALVGTLKAGGLCFLALNEQNTQTNLFLERLLKQASTHTGCLVIDNNLDDIAILNQHDKANCSKVKPVEARFIEQQAAIDSVIKTAQGRAKRPLVITADRGRGKTTALAMAAIKLVEQSVTHEQSLSVVITAPSKGAITVFFDHIKSHSKADVKYVDSKNKHIRFMPIDQLLQNNEPIDLLLVDEAAGIPVYHLKRLAQQYSRVVFSTTIHGYEGAGRGFSIKFLSDLKHTHPNAKHLHLTQPIRWQQDDPLEQLLFKVCCLNAQLAAINSLNNHYEISLVSPRELISNEQLLQQVFAILVTAHYQTKPSDLKLLLDNPSVRCFVLKEGKQPLAVCLAIEEGGLTTQQVSEVQRGQRRFKNQFTPQALLMNGLTDDAFNYQYLRVIRIAVHPECQSLGVGSKLLYFVEQWAKQQNIDLLSTSFAVNHQILGFWFNNGFNANHLSFRADASSGEFSLLMTKAISKTSVDYGNALHNHFVKRFDYLIPRNYQAMPPKLVAKFLRQNALNSVSTLPVDISKEIALFCQGKMQYHSASYAMAYWLIHHCSVTEEAVYPLIAQLVMNIELPQICNQFGFSGKRQFELHCRDFFIQHVPVSIE